MFGSFSMRNCSDRIRRLMPAWLFSPLRRLGTAILTPWYFSFRSGHFSSSIRASAVNASGKPVPWYTYPCNHFLEHRDFSGKHVLEFGGGQSSLWWGSRATSVLTFEGDKAWYERIRASMPANVDLRLVLGDNVATRIGKIRETLEAAAGRRYDVIIIDGLDRHELVSVAIEWLAPQGIIICDNAEGYGFHAALRGHGFSRVDFIGHAPGVMFPHCTSVVFKDGSFVFDNDRYPISVEISQA